MAHDITRLRLLRELRDRLLDALHADKPLTDRDELKRLLRQVEEAL